ncbi:MAG: IS1 family transposase [Ignavibacteriales bacterium]|nr:IS1 family transposase [Ignavibacteriales bacterium]
MRKPVKRNIACLNEKCRLYGKKFKRNIKKNGFRKKVQNYKCTACDKQFVETYGTPLYCKKLKKREIKRICELFTEKLSFRAVSRVTNHKLDTIRNLAEDMAQHCRETTNFFLKDLSLTPIEVDEIWTFVKKNKKELPKNFERSVAMAIRTLT